MCAHLEQERSRVYVCTYKQLEKKVQKKRHTQKRLKVHKNTQRRKSVLFQGQFQLFSSAFLSAISSQQNNYTNLSIFNINFVAHTPNLFDLLSPFSVGRTEHFIPSTSIILEQQVINTYSHNVSIDLYFTFVLIFCGTSSFVGPFYLVFF